MENYVLVLCVKKEEEENNVRVRIRNITMEALILRPYSMVRSATFKEALEHFWASVVWLCWEEGVIVSRKEQLTKPWRPLCWFFRSFCIPNTTPHSLCKCSPCPFWMLQKSYHFLQFPSKSSSPKWVLYILLRSLNPFKKGGRNQCGDNMWQISYEKKLCRCWTRIQGKGFFFTYFQVYKKGLLVLQIQRIWITL